jgi:hypothetical protein
MNVIRIPSEEATRLGLAIHRWDPPPLDTCPGCGDMGEREVVLCVRAPWGLQPIATLGVAVAAVLAGYAIGRADGRSVR